MNVINFKLATFSLMGLAIYAVYLFAHSFTLVTNVAGSCSLSDYMQNLTFFSPDVLPLI